MADSKSDSNAKTGRPKARLPRGFRDRSAAEIAAERAVLETVRRVYESYGFSPLETPAFEYTDALGKFLPDLDRPNEGVFSLQDDDGQWLSLRYDLTAPLARHVAANFQHLTKPFRRYQLGPVWRNEKPGPGRFREFLQFDADTVGSSSPAADAELLMMVSDVMEALGLKRGEYIVKLNNRKLLDGLLESVSLDDPAGLFLRLSVLRAIDKLDRLGPNGVFALLTGGRKDESGDFTKGAGLSKPQADNILRFLGYSADYTNTYAKDPFIRSRGSIDKTLNWLGSAVELGPTGMKGLEEIVAIVDIVKACGYADGRIEVDPNVVRGLEYYTGPVFEAQLTFPVKNEAGETVVFGSVAGGGRYDDLVARFTGQAVPATGVSIGVSRLLSALLARGVVAESKPLIVVTVMEKKDASLAFQRAAMLRRELKDECRIEAYVGTGKFGDQMKYADRRGATVVLIEGGDEQKNREVILKDMELGRELAKSVENRAAWIEGRPAQIAVKYENIVAEIRDRFLDPS
jgi:histidyl-tRNA synthetase